MAKKPKVSRGLSDRRRLARMIHHVLEAHWPRLLQRRAELLGAVLREGETLPDGELELALWLRVLDRDLAVAEDAELQYNRGLIVLAARQEARGLATATLKRQLGGLRQAVDMALGAGSASKLLDFGGRTRRRHALLEHQAASALVRLGALTTVKPILQGVTADREQWMEMIRAPLAALKETREQAALQEKSVEGLLLTKKKSFATFDETARGLIRKAAGELQLLGEKALAKRLRRFTRRRKRPGPKKKPKAAGAAA